MSPFRFVGFPGSFFSPSFRVTAHPVLPFFLWGCFKPAGNISIASVSAIHRIVLICVITRCFYGGFVSDGKSVLGGFFRTLQAACSFYCVISAGSVFRTGTFLDNLESFAGTILFCQICPLTVRPSPMPDETEQPDRKTACSADLRFRFASCRRVYPPLSRRGAVRRLVPPVRSVRTLLGVPAFLVRCGGVFVGFRDGSSDRCANRAGQAVTRALRRCGAKRETGTRFVE